MAVCQAGSYGGKPGLQVFLLHFQHLAQRGRRLRRPGLTDDGHSLPGRLQAGITHKSRNTLGGWIEGEGLGFLGGPRKMVHAIINACRQNWTRVLKGMHAEQPSQNVHNVSSKA